MEDGEQPVRLPMPARVTRLARRVPHPRYRRTEGIPRATDLRCPALRSLGLDMWLVTEPGERPGHLVLVPAYPWWAQAGRG